MRDLRLGINIDHIATVRNARGGELPDPVRAALLAQEAGADGITAHLREDRRHIRDDDIYRLMEQLRIPLNFEMAATSEMLAIALDVKPHAVCLVPERREELTTEGGLNVASRIEPLKDFMAPLLEAGIRVSLFVDADAAQVEASAITGAPVIELHTGAYCDAPLGEIRNQELKKLKHAATLAETLGLECHAGHGLDYETVGPVAAIPALAELNIGHFLMGEAFFVGLDVSVKRMRKAMDSARQQGEAAA